MNANLLNIVKRIISEQGEGVLDDAQRLKPLFSDYAKHEPKEDRVAFGRCIEMGAYRELKNVNAAGRPGKKAMLADRMNAQTGIPKTQCSQSLDLLEAAVFGVTSATLATSAPAPVAPAAPLAASDARIPQPGATIFCNNCGIQLPAGGTFCNACGAKLGYQPIIVNVTNPQPQASAVPEVKIRHIVASVWLWWNFLASILGLVLWVVVWIFLPDMVGIVREIIPGFTYNEWLVYGILIDQIFILVGTLKLLRWKRRGFTWLLVGGGISLFTTFMAWPPLLAYVVAANLMILVTTFALLRLRNLHNSKTTWEQCV